jgi:hypothetical protein
VGYGRTVVLAKARSAAREHLREKRVSLDLWCGKDFQMDMGSIKVK